MSLCNFTNIHRPLGLSDSRSLIRLILLCDLSLTPMRRINIAASIFSAFTDTEAVKACRD
jgi:hypothetical protein